MFNESNTVLSAKKWWKKLTELASLEKLNPACAYVQVLLGKVPGMTVSLNDGQPCRIGRQADICDLVVSDAAIISRVHCVACYDRKNGRISLHDKSSNGVRLEDGTELRGGSVELRRDTTVYLSGGQVVLRFALHGR